MNLSKVYSTQDTFQPEEIVRAKLAEPPVFGSSIIPSGLPDQGFKRQERPSEPPSAEPPPAAAAEKKEPPGHAEKKTPPPKDGADREQPRAEEVQTGDAPPPREKNVAPPPPPPGISQAEVDRLTAASYQKGVAAGIQQAEHDFGAASAALLLICQEFDTLRETVIRNSVGEIKDLVIAIAEKVIRHSVQEQSETIVETVEEAIQKAVKSGEFYIYVHPEDYAAIAAKAPELVAEINGLKNIVVKRDAKIDRGGCRLESDNCTVDGTIAGQLEIIRENLQEQ